MDTLVGGIAGASGEQSQGIDQVGTAVSAMDKVTQSTAATAEESAAAAQELSAQSQKLQMLVGDLRELVGATRARESAEKTIVSPALSGARLAA
jgi:methyl-accepting chemotaxis protein